MISKGRLKVIEVNGARYKVACECGHIFMSWRSRWLNLTGRGCRKCTPAIVGSSIYKHRGKTEYPSEYNSWRAMKMRCTQPSYHKFRLYGGRGISVIPRWLGEDGFINFLTDMGRKPSPKHSLDRINGDGNYEPSNCKWATQFEQMSHVKRA